jgi:hypothetical protein
MQVDPEKHHRRAQAVERMVLLAPLQQFLG